MKLGATRSAIDWRYVVNLLRQHGYDDTITLECFSEDIGYLITSRDKFRAHWDKRV